MGGKNSESYRTLSPTHLTRKEVYSFGSIMPTPPSTERDPVRLQRLIELDASDFYNRRAKWVLVPVLAMYIFHSVFLSRGQRSDTRSISGEGLAMDLVAPLPLPLLHAHSSGAIVLVLLTLLQKETVPGMLHAPTKDGSRPLGFATSGARLHRRLGYGCLTALAVMDAAGYAMHRYSAFANFDTFSVLFALPFASWLVAIPLTARCGWMRAHRLASNMLLKGCIATPLSRLGGALLQHRGWPTAAGYYSGIFGVASVIALWQVADLVLMWREAQWEGGDAKTL